MSRRWIKGVSLVACILSAALPGAAQDDLPAAPASPRMGAEIDGEVVLNFEGADIREVIHSLATALGLNYVIDPRVQGQVTVRTTGKIPRSDLFPVFNQILRSHGIAIVQTGDVHQIMPVGEAKTRADLPDSRAERQQAIREGAFVIELVKVEHIAAEEMAKVLQPFVSPGGDVVAYPRGNLVILTDLASSVERLKELVRAFDTDTFRELRSQVYRIEHANVEDLGEELIRVLEPYGVTPKTPEERGVFVIPLSRLNSIVVVGFNPEAFAEVDRWIRVLDVPPEKGGGRTVHVYQVENAKAADLAEVLSGLYGGDGGGGSGGGSRSERGGSLGSLGGSSGFGGNTRGNTGRRNRGRGGTGGTGDGFEGGSGGVGGTGGRRGGRAGGVGGIGGDGGAVGGTQTVLIAPKEGEKPIFKEEVRIVADEISNSLVILATARDYEMIKTVLRRLDVVPRQVLIEALIAEVGLTGDLQFGVEYAIANKGLGSVIGRGTGGTDGDGDGTGTTGSGVTTGLRPSISDDALLGAAKRAVNVGGEGLFAFITDRDQFLVLLRALAAQSRLNILATPHVIAADNREAHILIGEEIPILTSTSTFLESDSDRVSNTIQYRDTGRILTILPQVNSAGLVNMEIRQEVSAVGVAVFGNTNSPSFISREAETTVVVQDGESVLIGGIIADENRRSRSGVPFLMDLPVLGRLFRVDREELNRIELIVLITPHVIRNRDEARSVTAEFESRIRNFRDMLERVRRPQPGSNVPRDVTAPPAETLPPEGMPLPPMEEVR